MMWTSPRRLSLIHICAAQCQGLAGVLGQAGGFALGKLRPELLWDDIGILAHGIHYADIKSVECGPGVLAYNAVLVQTSHLLKSQDCVLGGLPENPVHSHRGDVIIKLRHHREKVPVSYTHLETGLLPGDEFYRIDGHRIYFQSDAILFLGRAGEDVAVEVLRDLSLIHI